MCVFEKTLGGACAHQPDVTKHATVGRTPNAERRTSEKIYSGMVEAERIVKGHLNAYRPQNNALEKLSKEIVANLMLNENYIN